MAISPISNISFSKAVSFGNNNNSPSIVKTLPVAFALMLPTGCTPNLNGPIQSGDIFEYNTPTELVLPQKAADKNQPPTLTAIDVVSSGNKTLYIYGYSNKGETTGVNSVNLRFVKTNGEESEVVLDGQLTGFCPSPVECRDETLYLGTVVLDNNTVRVPVAFSEEFGDRILEILRDKKNPKSTIAIYPNQGDFYHYHMGGTGGEAREVSSLPKF